MLGDDVSHPELLAIRRDLEPNANPSVLAPDNAARPYYLLNDEVEFGRDRSETSKAWLQEPLSEAVRREREKIGDGDISARKAGGRLGRDAVHRNDGDDPTRGAARLIFHY